MSTYAEKLKDPRWQRKRLEILQRDNFACRDCGATDKHLHVHHSKYAGKNPWDVEDAYLLTLCEKCHSARGTVETDIRERIASLFIICNIEYLTRLSKSGVFLPSEDYYELKRRAGE